MDNLYLEDGAYLSRRRSSDWWYQRLLFPALPLPEGKIFIPHLESLLTPFFPVSLVQFASIHFPFFFWVELSDLFNISSLTPSLDLGPHVSLLFSCLSSVFAPVLPPPEPPQVTPRLLSLLSSPRAERRAPFQGSGFFPPSPWRAGLFPLSFVLVFIGSIRTY